MKHTIEVGDRVKDKLTGFTGIVIAKTEWLNGCSRMGVQSEKLKDGKTMDAEWFDEVQLTVAKKSVHRPTGKELNAENPHRIPGGPQLFTPARASDPK